MTQLTIPNKLNYVLHLTIDQKPNGDDFAKAREVIEIRGTGSLTLHDRRVMNLLYANAGQRICDDVQHTISIAEVRGNHKGGERVKDSIIKLMTTLVQVPVLDRHGKAATQRVQLLSDNTSTDDEDDPNGQIIYSFSPGMRKIIRNSTLWGRVRTAVIFAFTSKYSLTLYELICARINLQFMWQEDFPYKDFRALMGVADNKLTRMPDFLRFCVKVAVDEVNGLSDFKVDIMPIRKGGQQRGLVTGFRVSWWRKNADELKEAFQEISRSKVGRLTRIRSNSKPREPIVFPPLPAPAE